MPSTVLPRLQNPRNTISAPTKGDEKTNGSGTPNWHAAEPYMLQIICLQITAPSIQPFFYLNQALSLESLHNRVKAH